MLFKRINSLLSMDLEIFNVILKKDNKEQLSYKRHLIEIN